MSDKLKAALKGLSGVGVSIAGLPKLKTKFPKKNLGALADEYHDIRDLRLALAKVADAICDYERAIQEHIIDSVSTDEGGVVGKRYKAIIKRETIPVVEDWDAFYEHVRKTRSFDLLNKALNRAACRERFEANKAIPGVDTFQAKKLSVTKV